MRTIGRPSFARRLAYWGLLPVIALFATAPVGWADTALAPIGGNGGGPFTERCAGTRFLHGLELTVGDTVDSVRAVCASALPGGQATNDAAEGARHGGANRVLRIACQIGKPAVLAVEVRYGGAGDHPATVYAIELACGLANGGPQTPSRQPGADFEGRQPTGSDRLFHAVFATFASAGQYCSNLSYSWRWA